MYNSDDNETRIQLHNNRKGLSEIKSKKFNLFEMTK